MSHAPSWLLAHTWSLSLEEQFYLAWPPLLVLLGKRKSRYLALACIVFSPALRLATYVLAPSLRGMVPVMLHTRLDTIMFGCAIALFWDEPRFHAAINKLLRADIVCGSIVYILIAPILSERFQSRYDWLIGYPLRGLLISIVMLYVVCKPASRMGYALNLAPCPAFGSHFLQSLSLAADVHCRPFLAFPRLISGLVRLRRRVLLAGGTAVFASARLDRSQRAGVARPFEPGAKGASDAPASEHRGKYGAGR